MGFVDITVEWLEIGGRLVSIVDELPVVCNPDSRKRLTVAYL